MLSLLKRDRRVINARIILSLTNCGLRQPSEQQ